MGTEMRKNDQSDLGTSWLWFGCWVPLSFNVLHNRCMSRLWCVYSTDLAGLWGDSLCLVFSCGNEFSVCRCSQLCKLLGNNASKLAPFWWIQIFSVLYSSPHKSLCCTSKTVHWEKSCGVELRFSCAAELWQQAKLFCYLFSAALFIFSKNTEA